MTKCSQLGRRQSGISPTKQASSYRRDRGRAGWGEGRGEQHSFFLFFPLWGKKKWNAKMWRHKKWVISPLSNEKWACERVRHLSRLQDVLSSRAEEDSLETFHSVRLWPLNGKTKGMTLREAEGETCAAGLTRKVPFQLLKGPKIFFSGWIYEGRRCVSLPLDLPTCVYPTEINWKWQAKHNSSQVQYAYILLNVRSKALVIQ